MDTNLSVCPRLSLLSICPISTSSSQLIRIKCLTATSSKLFGCLPFILIKLCCLFAVFLPTPIPCCPLPHLHIQAGWNTCSDVNYTHTHTHIHWHLLFSWKKEILPLGGTSVMTCYPCHMFVTHITSFHFPLMWLQWQQPKAAPVPHHDWRRISVFTLVKGVNAIFWRLS